MGNPPCNLYAGLNMISQLSLPLPPSIHCIEPLLSPRPNATWYRDQSCLEVESRVGDSQWRRSASLSSIKLLRSTCSSGRADQHSWKSTNYGRMSLAVVTFAPYLGPALGPIFGGLMPQHASWHWLFRVLSIFDAAVVLVALFVLRETSAPVLRRRHLIPPLGDWWANKSGEQKPGRRCFTVMLLVLGK